jgi:hypothetical protein
MRSLAHWRPGRKVVVLTSSIVALALGALSPGVALAGNAVTIQGNIARYEGTPLNAVHITSVNGGSSGSGTGWDCQSWWRFNGGTYFYSYSMQWFYSFYYQNNGGTVALGSVHTNGAAC